MTTGAETSSGYLCKNTTSLDVPDEWAVDKSQIWVWRLPGHRGGVFFSNWQREF